MIYRHHYRAGITPEDSQFLRRLRLRGFALALFTPVDVGNPLNRKVIEDQMLKAGKQVIKQMESSQ
jgi:hypothetical protein